MKTTRTPRLLCIALMLVATQWAAIAQVLTHDSVAVIYPDDSVAMQIDIPDTAICSLPVDEADYNLANNKKDGKAEKRQKRDWSKWRPEAKRAMWLALVLPGAGQVYNRKYWKLPIIYGGFAGCIYALTWNNQMYHDYSQAYMDIMDDDPTTESYKNFLHLGTEIDESNLSRYQEIFRKRKNRYRRWRDLSVFCAIAVYALSVIDAYVDASLSEFDISDDLSLRIQPVVMGSEGGPLLAKRGPLGQNAIGLGCSLTF